MNNLLRIFQQHKPDVTALSARLDGRLGAPASARLDTHLASCDACRGVLNGLRATRDALRALPDVEATRSFRLRAADVERAPVAAGRGADALRWAPALAAVAAAVFVVVLAADLRSNVRDPSTSSAGRQAFQSESSDSAGAAASAPRSPVGSNRAPESAPPDGAPSAAGAAGKASATPSATMSGGAANDLTIDAASVMATTTAAAAAAARGDVSATAAPAGDGGAGNNVSWSRVIELIAGATALAAFVATILRRRRGDDT